MLNPEEQDMDLILELEESMIIEPPEPQAWLGDPLLNQEIEHGRYRVEQALGWGGFSTVYEVRRTLTGQPRAMKVLHRDFADDDEARARFIHEASLLDQLDHPNIVRYFDAGVLEQTRQPFMLMEKLVGQSLHDALWATGEATLPTPEDAVLIGIQIASALAHAHGKGVLHRDLKPENIFLIGSEGGERPPRVKLIDFGISSPLNAQLSPEEAMLGTPQYVAPEQFEERTTFDARLDIYQLGAVLHVMLTGHTPHPDGDDNFVKVYASQLTYADGPGPRPSRLQPELERYIGLDALVARMLSNDRELRPMTARDALEALQHCLKVDFEAIVTDRLGEPVCGYEDTSQASDLLKRLPLPPATSASPRSARHVGAVELTLDPSRERPSWRQRLKELAALSLRGSWA